MIHSALLLRHRGRGPIPGWLIAIKACLLLFIVGLQVWRIVEITHRQARRKFERQLFESGEVCVTYDRDLNIIEYHRPKMEYSVWYCPDEDFHVAGTHGKLLW